LIHEKCFALQNTCLVSSADASSELTASKKKIEELEALCASQDLEVSTDCVYSFMLLEYINNSAREVPYSLACGSRNAPPTQP
jgi:hypothetical protein